MASKEIQTLTFIMLNSNKQHIHEPADQIRNYFRLQTIQFLLITAHRHIDLLSVFIQRPTYCLHMILNVIIYTILCQWLKIFLSIFFSFAVIAVTVWIRPQQAERWRAVLRGDRLRGIVGNSHRFLWVWKTRYTMKIFDEGSEQAAKR